MTQQAWRRSIHVDGVRHKAPIPMACQIGNLVFTSAIMGTDPATGRIADGVDAQVAFAFQHLDSILRDAGGDASQVGRLTIYLGDEAGRDAVNREWLARFPDPDDRPARHIVVKSLPGGMLAQLEAIAVLKSEAP